MASQAQPGGGIRPRRRPLSSRRPPRVVAVIARDGDRDPLAVADDRAVEHPAGLHRLVGRHRTSIGAPPNFYWYCPAIVVAVLQLFSFPSGDPAEFERLGPADYAGLEHLKWFQSVGGYNAMNASRPQTVAVGLSDSPVGQLAYSELFNSFGNGTSLVAPEQILTQVSLYWLTNTSATAARYYYEEVRAGAAPAVNTARTGVAVFADDFQTIRAFAERDNSAIVHWSRFDTGGHYAAMEQPAAAVGDLRAFLAAS